MTITTAITYDIRQKAFWCLFMLLTLSFISYAFLLNKTISNAIYVEEHQKQVLAERSSLADLEKEYLARTATVTIENAHNLGLVDDTETSYIKVSALNAEVSLGVPGRSR